MSELPSSTVPSLWFAARKKINLKTKITRIAANRWGKEKEGEQYGKKKKKEKHNPESITSVLLPVLFKTHVPSLTALWLLENMTVTSMVWVCGLY